MRLLILSFITGFSGAIMPGPLLVVVIAQTTVQGFRAVIGLITGHLLLELLTVIGLIFGLQAVLARPRVRGSIGLIGGAAMIWMGWDMLRHLSELSLNTQAGEEVLPYSWPMMLFWGAAVCAANPYFTGWWATIGAGQLAHLAPRTIKEYLYFLVGHWSSDYVWYSIIGLIIVTGRNWLTDEIYRGIILIFGLMIVLVGIWFFIKDGRLIVQKQRGAGARD